jgi:hypothetical protein
VQQGANQAFTIAPTPATTSADVLVDGGSVGPVTNYTFTNVQSAHTIAASFALDDPNQGLVARWPLNEGSGKSLSMPRTTIWMEPLTGAPGWVDRNDGAGSGARWNESVRPGAR